MIDKTQHEIEIQT